LLPAIYVWQWPSLTVWGWAIVVAFCGTFSHYCMARALLYADASVVVPMDFLRVPLTALMGWLLYWEQLDAFTVLGAALILAGNFLNLRPANPLPVRARPGPRRASGPPHGAPRQPGAASRCGTPATSRARRLVL